ncbi:MAG: Zn-dependent alcohol dehydrogenase [Actinomycetota bacterium]|jgi:S-(hydroxymethyl)glutathione dehydrogenase/alcohol dehydrogenase|nr:Zn-dependent alcohol dehydrogenase [Actinomycetota bacterium]
MRAAVFHEVGKEEVEVRDDVEVIGPGAGQVRVKIHAAGVCHSDLSAMNGTLPQPAPAVLGHEGAGEIVEVGEGVTSVSVGDHVIIAWTPPCGTCKFCTHGHPNLCVSIFFNIAGAPHFTMGGTPIFGFAGTGTMAEETVVPVQGVVPIAADVPYDVAALIGCGVTTGVGAALNTAKVVPGSSVAVFGCGGVGIAAIQGAKIAGAAEIVAVDTVAGKLDDAKRFGATHAVEPSALDATSMELTGGDGFDYAFECIGLSQTIRAAYDAVRRGGTAVIVGAGRNDQMVEFNAFELFFMEKRILGSYYGSADVRVEFDRLIRLWRSGRLDLEGMVTRSLDISQANEAFGAMKRGEVIRQVLTF